MLDIIETCDAVVKSRGKYLHENGHDVTVYFVLDMTETHTLLSGHGKILARLQKGPDESLRACTDVLNLTSVSKQDTVYMHASIFTVSVVLLPIFSHKLKTHLFQHHPT